MKLVFYLRYDSNRDKFATPVLRQINHAFQQQPAGNARGAKCLARHQPYNGNERSGGRACRTRVEPATPPCAPPPAVASSGGSSIDGVTVRDKQMVVLGLDYQTSSALLRCACDARTVEVMAAIFRGCDGGGGGDGGDGGDCGGDGGDDNDDSVEVFGNG